MPRSACARATARLTVKWLDHRYHRGRSVKTLRIIKLLTPETVDDSEFHTVFDDELEERHRRHMLLLAWLQVKPRGYVQ
jgi:hypothetical protein